ncbi:MAG: hypothetical protein HYT20_00070 [Candidatus Nealsonbacteria bacterium]|nr:hypothetical protein [Candidatus Nealsonbacteria bacterium]
MSQTNTEKIQDIIKEFFSKTGIALEGIEIKTPLDSTIPINLKMEEPQTLIGEGGQTLMEVQRLLKMVLQRKIASDAHFYIDLDINDYKKKKTNYLKEMARSTADEVSLVKKEKYLPAMSAYDRRVVHVELASRQDIVTESVGYDPERKVVIRPRLL